MVAAARGFVVAALLAAWPAAAQNVDPIVAEGVIGAPVGAVWAAWTTGEGLRSWLAPHAEVDVRIGGLMRTNYSAQGSLGDSGTIENMILSLDPGRMLSIRVAKTPAGFPFPNAVKDMWTVIYFDALDAMRTRIRVVGLGFGPDAESQKMRAFFDAGNRTTVDALVKRFGPAGAQARAGSAAVVSALRRGGQVIVMRHASSPSQPPSGAAVNSDNVAAERQLDVTGRSTAAAMGEALRRLKIPVGEVLTSPTYRARETAQHAQLPDPKPVDELGDGGQSMKGAAASQGIWLRKRASESPRSGNTVLITHLPNIAQAFPDAGDVAEGEALVFAPDGLGAARLVGRIRIDEWPEMR